ncbi:MAG: hypothetical protein ACLP0J_09250 [Solirubrobacteraceae bacterium]|jgi:hypothetical protein
MHDWCYPPTGGTQDVFLDRASARSLPTIVAGEGIYLIDDRGRRLLDVRSGPFLAALVRVMSACSSVPTQSRPGSLSATA